LWYILPFFCTFMETSSTPRFGPAAQTPAQRAWVVTQMHQAIPSLKKQLTAPARALYARYIAGELSWQQMRQAMEAGASS
jgi:hypothetical protein